MKNRTFKTAVIAVAIVVLGGVMYFGANNAFAALSNKSQVKVYTDESALLSKEEQKAFEAVVDSMNNLKKVTSSTTSKIKRFVQIGDYCFIKTGGNYLNIPCP